MSKASPPIHYWDSCTFINIIQGNEPDGGIILKQNIKLVDKGELLIVTSTFTLTEVVRPRRNAGLPLPNTDAEKIKNVFANDNIGLYDLSQTIAERARDLQWLADIKPADAVHIATAEYANVVRFDTYDDKLIKKIKDLPESIFNHKFEIGHPFVGQHSLNLDT